MPTRITMGMKMNTYRYNLMQSTNTLNDSMLRVQKQRKFNSYAESPAEATQAWRVRQDFMDNDSFKRNTHDTYTRFQTAWLTMGSVKTHLEDATGRTAIIRGMTDTTAAAKTEVGGVLINTADTIIQAMNGAKYGEEFVFSGTDGSRAPFSWNETTGDLLYRGVSITPPDYNNGWKDLGMDWGTTLGEDGIPKDFFKKANYDKIPAPEYEVVEPGNTLATSKSNMEDKKKAMEVKLEALEKLGKEEPPLPLHPSQNLEFFYTDENSDEYKQAEEEYNKYMDKIYKPYQKAKGEYETAVEEYEEAKEKYDTEVSKKEWYEYFQNMRTLNKMSEEVQYADLGMGMKEITDADGKTKMISSTIFNNATPGINMLGYGVDEDGDPKNLVLIMKELGELLCSCDEQGHYPNEGDEEKAFRLFAKFDELSALTLKGYTYTDVQGKYLQSNETTLKDQETNLNEQIADLEKVDEAQAISMFMWDYSCYSAGLKIGTQLLSESLIDYMR